MRTNKYMHIEKARVVRRFVEAQTVFAVLAITLFVHMQQWSFVVAVFIILALQLIQLFFMSRPYRVANMKKWVGGMVFGVFLKYIVFVVALLVFLSNDSSVSISAQITQETVLILCALIAGYCVPFWYSGIRLSIFKSQKSILIS